MHPSPLNHTVGAIMRPLHRVYPEMSVEAAGQVLRESGGPIVAISDGQTLQGVVTESSLVLAIARGVTPTDPVAEAATPVGETLRPHYSGAEALRRFEHHPLPAFVVTDESGRPLGMLAPSDLLPKRAGSNLTNRVGGMATPFGVYLTTGYLRAGASNLALVSTGMLLFAMLLVTSLGCTFLADYAKQQGAMPWAVSLLNEVLPFVLFLLGMRLMPLSGVHAAEHMVVHAIERGEQLVPEVVKRMPRVHPRCGTNIAVGGSLFFGLAGLHWITDDKLRVGLALLATLAFWRPLGSFVQYWVTTKKPTDKQIQMGIKSGLELLEKNSAYSEARVGFARRLWYSGMFHVMSGALLMFGIVAAIDYVFNLRLPL